jgi:nitroreductase
MNEVLKAIKNRRSVRVYRSEQLRPVDLDQILEAGIYAPSGHNTQPWHFTVIQNRAVMSHINDLSKKVMAARPVEWIQKLGANPEFDLTYHAPTLIIVSGRTDAITWKTDCDAAMQNMMLAAESLNIGSVWLGFATFGLRNNPAECRALGIPEGYEAHYGMALGYKTTDTPIAAPERNKNVVNYIR